MPCDSSSALHISSIEAVARPRIRTLLWQPNLHAATRQPRSLWHREGALYPCQTAHGQWLCPTCHIFRAHSWRLKSLLVAALPQMPCCSGVPHGRQQQRAERKDFAQIGTGAIPGGRLQPGRHCLPGQHAVTAHNASWYIIWLTCWPRLCPVRLLDAVKHGGT